MFLGHTYTHIHDTHKHMYMHTQPNVTDRIILCAYCAQGHEHPYMVPALKTTKRLQLEYSCYKHIPVYGNDYIWNEIELKR